MNLVIVILLVIIIAALLNIDRNLTIIGARISMALMFEEEDENG